MSRIDYIASRMREAYGHHTDHEGVVVPWNRAAPDVRDAWRICAEAAIKADEEYRSR